MARGAGETPQKRPLDVSRKRITQASLLGAQKSWASAPPPGLPRDPVEFYYHIAREMGWTGVDGRPFFPVYLKRALELVIHQRISFKRHPGLRREQKRLQRLHPQLFSEDSSIEGQSLVLDIGPRHLKTTTVLVGALYSCAFGSTGKKLFYGTYSDEIARLASNQFADMARAVGLSVGGTIGDRIVRGSTVFFRSLNSTVTGIGVNWTSICDDTIKGWAEAMSQTVRDRVWQSMTTCVFSRFEFESVNSLIVGTRWSEDDPQGRALANPQRSPVHITAPALMRDPLSGELTSIAPRLRPVAFLLRQKAEMQDDAMFDTLYNAVILSDRRALFVRRVIWTCDIDPQFDLTPRYRRVSSARGVDLAYGRTRKDSGDWCCTARVSKTAPQSAEDWYLVIDDVFLLRGEPLSVFFSEAKSRGMSSKEPLHWYAGGQELKLYPEVNSAHSVNLQPRASLGKLANAQGFMRLWNAGRVLVHESLKEDPHLREALKQVFAFTGGSDSSEHEDALDTLGAAVDALVPRAECRDGALRETMSALFALSPSRER